MIAAYLFVGVRRSPCDQPIEYRVDTVDPRFNLTRDQFVKDVDDAQKIWSQKYGKPLFTYNPNADLRISLIYDERQQLNTQIGQLQGNLQNQKGTLTPEIQAYNNQVAAFKTKVDAFNSQVAYWNSKGGAPKDIYEQLQSQQLALKTEGDQLNATAQKLNIATQNFNAQVGQLNQTIDTFNAALSMRPEEGFWDGRANTITIYFNISQPELIHTLAHEMGHALGMGHVEDPQAIMFYKTNQTLIPEPQDIVQLQNACEPLSLLQATQSKLQFLLQKRGE